MSSRGRRHHLVHLPIVQGRGPTGNAGQRTIEALVAGMPLLKYGVFATGNLSMGNNQISDGFNSDVAPYPLSWPSGGFAAASSIPTSPNVSYDPSTGILSLSSDANLVHTGTQYYFKEVNISGQATLTVSNGSSHTRTRAPQRSLLACGTPSSPSTWTVSGGAGAYYSVYAPNHDIQVSGNGDICGALVGKNISFSGNGKAHYDAALLNNTGTALAVVSGSLAELASYRSPR